ncbi:two-component system response regulator TorR [Motiliproteus coralliicola]|uniref:Two-component system response regulator TorR n=1 Tax=Motiliproteus coralliicola TaxID=2283196 RepID=A0A369WBR1_9GAMM|nr:two-component system response regulator TorR [Motiliproteus coralliicola]RDE19172.1 two-component system response regulator TorR [Motiliproteus coralliicola]
MSTSYQPAPTYHVLVVEDDPITRLKLSGYFENAGYRVSQAGSGVEMREELAKAEIDLVLLDINLPGEDGLALTRELRGQSSIGIILVTGRTDTVDRIVGLEMGADDYVTKPVELRELLVRVKNLLWRISLASQSEARQPEVEEDSDILRFGDWRFDIPRRKLCCGDQPVKLTKAEYEILVAFVAYPNRVLSRERLLNLISHRVDSPSDRTIDVLVRRLRNKIEIDPKAPEVLITVHGEGYLFAAEVN